MPKNPNEIDFHVYLWSDSVEKLDALVIEMGAKTRAEALHAIIKESDGLVRLDDADPAIAEENVPTVSRFMKVRFGVSTQGCPKLTTPQVVDCPKCGESVIVRPSEIKKEEDHGTGPPPS